MKSQPNKEAHAMSQTGSEFISLHDWIEQFKSRFNERELKYMAAHKASIVLQLKDKETGEIYLHQLDYRSKEAQNLEIVPAKREEQYNEQSIS
ncbi:hypothetical protein N9K06_00650 [Omnitrophica bacterium]|nr:hypothetical protein [Candidatus Omnitrophota bacterium]